MNDEAAARRNILWIDGAGAWLVCLHSPITIGQASGESSPVDIPLLADVSRIHATLTREDESWLVESTRDMTVNDRPTGRSVLKTGDRLRLGTCDLKFSLPVPGSLSGVLKIENGRRLPMAVQGVLLMADMLVLGTGDKVHAPLPGVAQPVYLFRQKDRLGIRWPGPFTIDGEPVRDRAMLPAEGCVASAEFSFAIEALHRNADSTPGRR